jgi:hypothetical protein
MITVRREPGPASAPVEGLGHPDTLADALAERLSVAYSRHCLQQYGAVLHHNLDKLYLRGGHCRIGLGDFEMTDPVTLTIGGRVSASFAGQPVPYRELFEEAARGYLATALPGFDHARWLRTEHATTSRSRFPSQAGAAEAIAAGAEDAAARARSAVLIAQMRDAPAPGDAETATADCSSYRDSPYPSPDGGCGASFLTCLACPNARVHPGHHPRLAHLHEALASLRSVLPPAAWAADWRDACERLEDLRGQVGDGPWGHALARVTSADREIVTHLLTGNLDR